MGWIFQLGLAFMMSLPLLKAKEAELKIPPAEKLIFSGIPEASLEDVVKQDLSLELRVKASNPRASVFTSAGFNYLHLAWDFEAYRHFCQAIREDENCLMAHVGIALSLSSPYYHEMLAQRKVAVVRMLELVEAKVDEDYVFPEKERALAVAIAHLFIDGRATALGAFKQLAERYPEDPQIPLLYAIFHRDGYDALNKPKSGESKALEMIEQIRRGNPEHPLAAQYLLSMYKEAPVAVSKLQEILPVARALVKNEKIEICAHWLGVMEYRCGNLEKAEAAFRKADGALLAWKKRNGISNADASSLWRTRLFLATVLMEQGKLEEVEEIATSFSRLKIPEERLWATGSQLILWDGWTLATRVNLSLNALNTNKAMEHLASAEMLEPFKGKSSAVFFHDTLHYYLALKKAHEAKDKPAVKGLKKIFFRKMVEFDKLKTTTAQTGEVHAYTRGGKWLRKQTAKLRGEMEDSVAMKVLELGDAVSEESLPVGMLPPFSFFAFEEPLVSVLLQQKRYDRAKELIARAIQRRPSLPALWELAEKTAQQSEDRQWLETLKERQNPE